MTKKQSLLRLFKLMMSYYPVMLPVSIVCIFITAIVTALPSVFLQMVFAIIGEYSPTGDWVSASNELYPIIGLLIGLYIISIITSITYTQLMAVISQGTLMKLRQEMFATMQKLPISYFDTHSHGDIMSYYTNDIDTLRQMISQSFPQFLRMIIMITAIFIIMLWYSLWMTLVIVVGLIGLLYAIKRIGGNSARYFIKQQESIGATEGYIEEMINGQKVIKVFNHEEDAQAKFDIVNEDLFETAYQANKYANILGPILNNTGNILYVVVAIVGGTLLTLDVPNVSISGLPLSIAVVVPYLNMTKQFVGNIGRVSHQINAIVMAISGLERIFQLMDLTPEVDQGNVTLVNMCYRQNEWIECNEKADRLAWRIPHHNGTIEYRDLQGDVRFENVDFGYTPDSITLKNINLYAEPGQKIAFVGATGAGKTTITNLINRFYDIQHGNILYDGIPLKNIQKDDLRRSLGIVLQDTNLFTGSVLDNIRYGKLNATREECIAAARLAGADDFITRLPDGYDTIIKGDGALSQGQKQLITIARAAVYDPPVMILDEATSSIDTRTEAIVQKGMDSIMEGRTVFVIAHRLSTVKNSDVIIVLDQGQIIERGTHEDLLEQKGTYYQLYTGSFELE